MDREARLWAVRCEIKLFMRERGNRAGSCKVFLLRARPGPLERAVPG